VRLALVFLVAVGLFLPTVRYGFVEDDRGIIVHNPAAHSVGAALSAFDAPYWPRPARAGLYRPATILTYGVDWRISGGRPGWFHLVNAVLHGIVAVLVVLLLERWLPAAGAVAAGLVFAVHPVHVEAVASVVSRAELLVALWMLVAVLAARRGWWTVAVISAALAMLSKEHGVITGVVMMLDDWLRPEGTRRYPPLFYGAVAAVTLAYLGVWYAVGGGATADVAAAFLGQGLHGRLGIALPAILQAARLLVWPLDLSADYNPQVIPAPRVLGLAALGGALVVAGIFFLVLVSRRRWPALCFGAAVAALAHLPTSNLLFPSGVVLAERNLYLPVLLAAVAVGYGVLEIAMRSASYRRTVLAVAVVVLLLGTRSALRLGVWRDNRDLLVTTLEEHPESYRAHLSAAAVYAGMRNVVAARREYAWADSLFPGDPQVPADRAYYELSLGDTAGVAAWVERARALDARQPVALRAGFLLELRRGAMAAARAVGDTASGWYPEEAAWYTANFRAAEALRPP
jgi:protein O-mannosyl-transferase